MICVQVYYITAKNAERVGNRRLKQKEPRHEAWQFPISPQKNRWQALRAATEKAARQSDRFRFSSELVRAARIELASHAWKARILAIIRRPRSWDYSKFGLCWIPLLA